MLSTLKRSVLQIDSEDVLKNARSKNLDVQTIQDFRKQRYHYADIEEMMDDYRDSFARRSALGGLTTGIGGLTTAITFAGINSVVLAISLYRLAQQFAVMNGFDGDDPLQKNRMMRIYFEALGVNAVMETALKKQCLNAGTAAETGQASESLMLRLIIRTGRILGKDISSEEAGRFIPVVGGIVGAGVNYVFAQRASKQMKQAFKEAYFNTWQGEQL